MTDIKKLLQTYFQDNTLMQLVTVDGGMPWVCNVYFVTDEDSNIYWTSAKKRQHSQEILKNSISAATIVHDSEKKQAVSITGESFMVFLDDAERVNNLYADKFGDKPSRLVEVMENTPDGRAYWVLKPKQIFLWDEVNFPDEPKQECFIN